jgi:uncharacterized membrane protein
MEATMRTAALFAATLLATLTSCSDQDVATIPVKARPSFTVYTASASPGVILDPWNASTYTIAYGINDLGSIAGVSDGTSAVRWETGTAAAPTSTTALLVDNGGAIGRDINAVGQIAGERVSHAILWTPSGSGYLATDIGSLFVGAASSAAYGINAAGQVVGNYAVSNGVGLISKCFLWTPSVPNGTVGTAVTLTDLGGTFCVGNDINTAGQIAGTSTSAAAPNLNHAVVWSSALVPTDLLPGPDESYGAGLNDGQQVAGFHTPQVGPTTAALWTPNGSNTWSLLDLVAPAFGQPGVISSQAFDVDDAGFVVGYSYPQDASTGRAFFWQNGTFTELTDPVGAPGVEAVALTNLIGNLAIVTGSDIFDPDHNGRHGLRWAVTLAPISAQGCLADLRQLIVGLRGAATLSGGEATSLLAKVDAAARQEDQGRTTPAKNVLYALINEVTALRTSGRLSSTDAQSLIDAAQCAIASL